MLVWALPIWRDLEALKTAAQRMGQGDLQARARLSRAGSQRALARWQGLAGDAAPRVCGTVRVARDAGKSAALAGTLETLAFPSEWVRQVDRDEASALAGLPLAASVMAATLASFVLHTGIVVWVFSTGSATRAWLWLGAWSALMAGALAGLRALG
ncbi:hypothetical protein G6F61_014152 [Rhizopus arrhizus]|nr:hypothetical protein G6F61_014152 [Rhizopus arrhizus]